MPWDSVQQARWGHSPAGLKALGGKAKVAEWDAATTKGSLPRRAAVKMKTVNLGSKGSFKEKPGALHKDLGIPLGETIPKAKEEAAAHGSGKTATRARAALGFRAMHHG